MEKCRGFHFDDLPLYSVLYIVSLITIFVFLQPLSCSFMTILSTPLPRFEKVQWSTIPCDSPPVIWSQVFELVHFFQWFSILHKLVDGSGLMLLTRILLFCRSCFIFCIQAMFTPVFRWVVGVLLCCLPDDRQHWQLGRMWGLGFQGNGMWGISSPSQRSRRGTEVSPFQCLAINAVIFGTVVAQRNHGQLLILHLIQIIVTISWYYKREQVKGQLTPNFNSIPIHSRLPVTSKCVPISIKWRINIWWWWWWWWWEFRYPRGPRRKCIYVGSSRSQKRNTGGWTGGNGFGAI